MQEPTLAKHQKAEHYCISKSNKKSAIELHNNIYSSPMEGLKIQLKLLCTEEEYERRLAKLEQQQQKNKQKNTTKQKQHTTTKHSYKSRKIYIPKNHLEKDQNSKQDSSKSFMLNFMFNTSDSNV